MQRMVLRPRLSSLDRNRGVRLQGFPIFSVFPLSASRCISYPNVPTIDTKTPGNFSYSHDFRVFLTFLPALSHTDLMIGSFSLATYSPSVFVHLVARFHMFPRTKEFRWFQRGSWNWMLTIRFVSSHQNNQIWKLFDRIKKIDKCQWDE